MLFPELYKIMVNKEREKALKNHMYLKNAKNITA